MRGSIVTEGLEKVLTKDLLKATRSSNHLFYAIASQFIYFFFFCIWLPYLIISGM